jgi:ribosome maturation factor RimP
MDRIKEIVKRSAERFGLILIECLVSHGRIEAVIYRRGGIVGIKDLENVTKEIQSELFSVGLEGAYSIAISSPGLNRILKTREEIDIFAGNEVKVSFKVDENIIKEEAILEGFSGDNVVFRKNGEKLEVPFDRVVKISLYSRLLEKRGEKK